MTKDERHHYREIEEKSEDPNISARRTWVELHRVHMGVSPKKKPSAAQSPASAKKPKSAKTVVCTYILLNCCLDGVHSLSQDERLLHVHAAHYFWREGDPTVTS